MNDPAKMDASHLENVKNDFIPSQSKLSGKSSRKYRFSFGMILFNGDAFLKEALESIYDFAYEIIIIEGSDMNAVCMAGSDGGSADNTMRILENFPDPLEKIRIIRGSWKDKDEQSNRAISEATGDYYWQIDDDEVYKEQDLLAVEELLEDDPDITAVSFEWMNFFRNFNTVMIANPPYEVWRLFKIGPGCRFKTHRPPTVFDPLSGQVLNLVKPLRGSALAERGIYIYHYSYITDKQVKEKIAYHTNYRLRECNAGIPFLSFFSKYPNWENSWKRLWRHRIFYSLRKKFDSEFNYSYLHNVWAKWEMDPESVETRFGISPGAGPYRGTTRFSGSHPRSIEMRLSKSSEP